MNVLEVKNLELSFWVANKLYPILRKVNFNINPSEVFCLAGESGSGKSVISYAVMGLLAENARITGGSVNLNGESLLEKSEEEWIKIRGRRISMIFQEPMKALNPSMTIGHQLQESIFVHSPDIDPKEAYEKCIKMLEKIHIYRPKSIMNNYPHHLSGGMRQRVMIAIAVLNEPDLLIADEPTTALDVTVQSQVLAIIEELKEEKKMATLFITHDFGVISEIADRVGILYGGEIMEIGDVNDVLLDGKHPYTIGLINSIPNFYTDKNEELSTIEGIVPAIGQFPKGCTFSSRCVFSEQNCHDNRPSLKQIDNQYASCFRMPLESIKH